MPCYTETRVTVDLGKVDPERLQKAAELAGVYVRRLADGRVEVSAPGRQDFATIENALKQQYSVLTVQAASKRFGWKVQATTTKQSTTTATTKVVTMKLGR